MRAFARTSDEMGAATMGTGVALRNDRAVVALEAAIGNPLLEDMYLTGARSILVNLTAGRELSMGEFEEVRRTLSEFTSDDATIVAGTVIDLGTDELRVTIIAGRLGPLSLIYHYHRRWLQHLFH